MNFGMGSQDSSSQQRSGLRGTPYEDEAAQNIAAGGRQLTNFSNQMMASPQAMLNYGKQMLPGGKYGLGENSDAAVEQLGNYQFNKASADSSTRGQLSPNNMSNVIGSSIQNSLPFLIPQIQAFQTQQFMAPQGLYAMAKSSADYWNRALGAQADSSYSGFNFNGGVGGSKDNVGSGIGMFI